jgi:hypothetical protein
VTTAARHFQSADALAVAALPPERGGGLLAATYDVHGVAAWRLPAAGAVQALGPAQPPAVRLGGFQGLRDLYSLALSPDARWLAAGGEGGLLAFYSIDPTAPPRPEGPRRALDLSDGSNYFYTPLLVPGLAEGLAAAKERRAREQGQGQGPPQEGQQQQQQQQQQAGDLAGGGQSAGRRLSPLPPDFLQYVSPDLRSELRLRHAAIDQLSPAEMQDAVMTAILEMAGHARRAGIPMPPPPQPDDGDGPAAGPSADVASGAAGASPLSESPVASGSNSATPAQRELAYQAVAFLHAVLSQAGSSYLPWACFLSSWLPCTRLAGRRVGLGSAAAAAPSVPSHHACGRLLHRMPPLLPARRTSAAAQPPSRSSRACWRTGPTFRRRCRSLGSSTSMRSR